MNDKPVFIAPSPPSRHPCYRNLLYTCIAPPPTPPPCRTHYDPSPDFPPFFPQLAHFFKCILPLVASLGRPQLSSFTCSQCPSVFCFLSKLWGGLTHFQLLDFTRGSERGGVFCIQLSPSVSVPLLLHTSCSQTSGEAVPADTQLHKQWTPMYFPLI